MIIGIVAITFFVYSYNNYTQNKQIVSKKPIIASTIFPIHDIVRTIGGENIEAQLILPPGASPHTFELSPSDILRLQNTKLIFTIGHGIDNWSIAIADTSPDIEVITLDQNIPLRNSADLNEQYEALINNAPSSVISNDPHYWLSPNNAIIMAKTISTKLSQLDPAHTLDYKTNYLNFSNELETKIKKWQAQINNLPNRSIITFHDAFYYFAETFDLQIIATFEPSAGREPTARYMDTLTREIKKYNITTLFLEPQLYTESMRQFAKDNKLSLWTLDPIGGLDERSSYTKLIDYNIETLIQALQ